MIFNIKIFCLISEINRFLLFCFKQSSSVMAEGGKKPEASPIRPPDDDEPDERHLTMTPILRHASSLERSRESIDQERRNRNLISGLLVTKSNVPHVASTVKQCPKPPKGYEPVTRPFQLDPKHHGFDKRFPDCGKVNKPKPKPTTSTPKLAQTVNSKRNRNKRNIDKRRSQSVAASQERKSILDRALKPDESIVFDNSFTIPKLTKVNSEGDLSITDAVEEMELDDDNNKALTAPSSLEKMDVEINNERRERIYRELDEHEALESAKESAKVADYNLEFVDTGDEDDPSTNFTVTVHGINDFTFHDKIANEQSNEQSIKLKQQMMDDQLERHKQRDIDASKPNNPLKSRRAFNLQQPRGLNDNNKRVASKSIEGEKLMCKSRNYTGTRRNPSPDFVQINEKRSLLEKRRDRSVNRWEQQPVAQATAKPILDPNVSFYRESTPERPVGHSYERGRPLTRTVDLRDVIDNKQQKSQQRNASTSQQRKWREFRARQDQKEVERGFDYKTLQLLKQDEVKPAKRIPGERPIDTLQNQLDPQTIEMLNNIAKKQYKSNKAGIDFESIQQMIHQVSPAFVNNQPNYPSLPRPQFQPGPTVRPSNADQAPVINHDELLRQYQVQAAFYNYQSLLMQQYPHMAPIQPPLPPSYQQMPFGLGQNPVPPPLPPVRPPPAPAASASSGNRGNQHPYNRSNSGNRSNYSQAQSARGDYNSQSQAQSARATSANRNRNYPPQQQSDRQSANQSRSVNQNQNR